MSAELTPQQKAVAVHVYQHAIKAGLPPERAKEIVSAAIGESGLDPTNYHGRSQGQPFVPGKTAGGLMQLLSPGYVQKAQKLGGIFNPDANVDAILPDYANFWHQHPNAAPGQAASAVERSGEGAGYYSQGLRELSFLGGGGGGGGMGPAPMSEPQAPGGDARTNFALTIAQQIGSHKPPDFAALVDALQQLGAAPTETAPAAAATAVPTKGGYAFPVAGKANFTDTWGAPRADTGHHEGVDIFAERGTPVVAVQDGVVTKMGPSAIGGNRIWVNGKWYYAHLDAFAPGIKPGTRVKAGEVLGYVGDTGDAKGTPTHLHFGWSPDASQGASWADPYKFLVGLHG